jgi:PAS domain S-box-containing protein
MSREARTPGEQFFHTLVEHSADAIMLFTPDGTIIYANPSTARITGYTAQELVGMNSFAFIHPADKEHMLRLLTDLIEQNEHSASLEYRLCRQDGTWCWIEGTITNLLSDLTVGAIVYSFHDITIRKQQPADTQTAYANAEIQASRLVSIFETVNTALAVYDCDGNIKCVNSAFRNLFALESDNDLALLQFDAWCKWASPRDVEGKPLGQGLWSQLQALGKGLPSKQPTMKLITCDRTGRDFFLGISVFPTRDIAGQITGCVIAYLDVSQQHQLELQLQYAERKLRSLVEANVVGIMVTDEAGHMYEVNDWMAQALGYSREELLSGRIRVQDILVPEYRGARARAWKTLISQGSSLPEEKIYICKDGSRLPVLVAAAAINQERNRALVVSLDISDRKEAEQRREAFLSMVNHELRTPLTVIQGFLELALFYIGHMARTSVGEQDDLHKLATMLQQAQQQVEIESRLVTELLDVSRMEMQKFSLSLQRCDLISLVRQVIANQQQMLPTRRLELELPLCAEVPVMADADRIEQVINNYLSNAFKYSPPDRTVSVSMRIEGMMVRISVHDQGPGLTPEQQKRIWERFYQVETTRYADTFEGLGLGLYIVRTIVAQHQGQVGVESIPGQGSTFWFMLPLADDTDDACETQYVMGGGVDGAFHIT